MTIEKIPFSNTRQFSGLFLDYRAGNDAVKPFYGLYPDIEQFEQQIKDKEAFSAENRSLLAERITAQYEGITLKEPVSKNIELLKNQHTYTITTGHQLSLLTGPLYFIYKIVTTVNACRQLSEKYAGNHFVPVFWMASEDHDYEEIKSFRLFDKTHTWETQQHGAVGRFNIEAIRELLETIPCDTGLFEEAFQAHGTLAQAVRHYVDTLFGEAGLVIIDGDDHALKQALAPVMHDDIISGQLKPLVDTTSENLKQQGYPSQVNARACNFFLLDNQLRNRIEKKDDAFKIVGTELGYSAGDLQEMIRLTPEKFSPNVIIRPLYQEMILPNLAYVGGPGELAYWLQLKTVFEHYNVPFPILLPRNFAMVVDAPVSKRIQKTGIPIKDYFQSYNELTNQWVSQFSGKKTSNAASIDQLAVLYKALRQRATEIDPTLDKFTGALEQRAQRGLDRLEEKMMRAVKRQQEDRIRQIGWVKDRLFPNDGLQERVDNYLNFQATHATFLADLMEAFDPFDYRFNILGYD